MAVWVQLGNGFAEPNITLRRARMCRDAIERGEITLKELARELDVELTHFKRQLNKLLTDAAEHPIGAGPQIWSSRTNGRDNYVSFAAENENRGRCYIGEKIDTTALRSKIDEFLRARGTVTRIKRRTSIAA